MPAAQTENLALRRAVSAAHLRDRDVSEAMRVDPKTVQRRLAGRRPQARHRWALADLVGMHTLGLWSSAGPTPSIGPEVATSYPHRSSVPRTVWRDLFAGAQRKIGILVYSGLFLAEDVDLMQLLAGTCVARTAVR